MDSQVSPHNLASVLSSNRTEEIGYDVWDRFVIPPMLKIGEWGETFKPRVIVGGRGCGKTMLLRYLSHDSAFSPDRPTIDQSSLRHIGLYLRADTQFASLLQNRSESDQTWRSAFGHLIGVMLGREILRALRSVAKSDLDQITLNDLTSLDFSMLSTENLRIPSRFPELLSFFDTSLFEFERWANAVDVVTAPAFLPTPSFVRRLIDVVKDQLPQLKDVVFFAYIDEFENLATLQQRVVNTWIKHSEPPIVFNLAMKRNGFKSRETLGEESINEVHDFRVEDLEKFERASDFSLFAAEILLLRFHNAQVVLDTSNPIRLRDPSSVGNRRAQDYAQNVLRLARTLLPSWTKENLADQVFNDSALRRQLQSRITNGLKQRGELEITTSHFVREDWPTPASIVIPALLARNRLTTKQIVSEFDNLCDGKPNGFQEGADWLHNIFLASYLDLFTSLTRACPIYSGFETYCHMSKGNVRHFLELCHKAFEKVPAEYPIAIAQVDQAEAASQVAVSLLPEVRSFGNFGNDLHTFLLRLGRLFVLSQRRTSQSEPERTHFAIKDGIEAISDKGKVLLSEAIKWSVLFEEKETKSKTIGTSPVIDYVMNPIYAPYFQISYRKGRKLELTGADFNLLSTGSADDFRAKLYTKLLNDWKLDQEAESLSLWPDEIPPDKI